MKSPKSVRRGALTGEGRTVREAKADLERRVDLALGGHYEPKVFSWRESTAFIFREPSGWGYKLLWDVQPGTVVKVYSCGGYDQDYAKVEQEAIFHALDVSGSDEFHKDSDIPAALTDADKRSTLLGNARFRRAYADIKAAQPERGDTYWHHWAGDHERDERFA